MGKLLLILLDGVPCANWRQGLGKGVVLEQLALAPTILTRLGVGVPDTMQAPAFLTAWTPDAGAVTS